MKELIQALIELGYHPENAKNLCQYYEYTGGLEELREFLNIRSEEPPDMNYYYSY